MSAGKEPLVTIGVPVYNGERFLREALDSLLGQTLADFELVISDNASTDGTAGICQAYAARDRRIRYLRQPSNIGGVRNWNFVARQARGRYLKWASANDFCDLRMLEKCVEVLNADPGAVLCQGLTCMVDEDSGERRPFEHDFSAMDPRPSERFKVVSRNLLLNNVLCGVIRLDALRRTSLIRLYPAGDIVLTVELGLYGKFVLLPETLFYRRFGPRTWSMQLKPADLQAFLYADPDVHPGHERWRRRLDLLRAVLAAPISTSEKARTVAQAAQRATLKVPAKALQLLKRATPGYPS